MISRRPNRRASMENAPGPRKTMAALIATASTEGSLASNRFGVAAGNHANAMPRVPKPTRVPATGVRNPIESKAPLATAATPAAPVRKVRLPGSAK